MKKCEICGDVFPSWVRISGKQHNLQSRRYCLRCSPFKLHNTKALTVPYVPQDKACLYCGKLRQRKNKFCSSRCFCDFRYSNFIKKWLNGEVAGVTSGGLDVANPIKRWCREQSGGRCAICNSDQWMGEPIPLLLDHKDGNGTNNRPDNLRMICGNCNMKLPTFAGRNKGNGREFRRRMRRLKKEKDAGTTN